MFFFCEIVVGLVAWFPSAGKRELQKKSREAVGSENIKTRREWWGKLRGRQKLTEGINLKCSFWLGTKKDLFFWRKSIDESASQAKLRL